MATLSPRASVALLATTLAVCAAAVLPGTASAAQLLGNATVGTGLDSNSSGLAEAFAATATASGTLEELNLYLDSSSRATKVTLGIYTDVSSHPRTLLAQGSTTTPATGWNRVVVPPTTLYRGHALLAGAAGHRRHDRLPRPEPGRGRGDQLAEHADRDARDVDVGLELARQLGVVLTARPPPVRRPHRRLRPRRRPTRARSASGAR